MIDKVLHTKQVLHLMTRYKGGGSETYVNCLLDNISKNKYEQSVGYGIEYDRDKIIDLKKKFIKTVMFKNLKHFNPIESLLAIKEIYNYLINNDIDILHTHQTEAGIVGRIAGHLYKRRYNSNLKIIHTMHAIPWPKNRNIVLRCMLRIIEKYLLLITDYVLTIADPMKEQYCEDLNLFHTNRNRVLSIPCGIDRNKFIKAKPLKSMTEGYKDYFRLVIVSRITEGKGFEDIIKIVHYFNRYYKEIKFKIFIVGNGDERYIKSLLSIIENSNIEHYFVFTGYRKDVSRILKSVHAFILPSYFEGTPWTIYEAMASGLPIISTNVGNIPWQINSFNRDYNSKTFNNTSMLIEPGNIREFTFFIEYLYHIPRERKLINKNSIERSKLFTSEKMVNSILKVYDFKW